MNSIERADAGAWEARAVAAVFAACLSAAAGYTAWFASWVPWWDYWDLAEAIGGLRALDLVWLLEPHQEHRIPLSKLLLVSLAWAIPDIRAASLLNVAGCAVIAALGLAAARRLRGTTRMPDAVMPLLALHAGHYTTYLLGFQLQQVMSSLLVLAVLVLLLEPTRARTAGAAAALAVLPTCGVNGIVAAPPLLLWLGWRVVRSAPGRTPLPLLVLAAVAGLVGLGFGLDLVRLAGREFDPLAAVRTGSQFLATGFGVPAARSPGLVLGLLGLSLLGCTPALAKLVRADAESRNAAFGIAALLAGSLVLAGLIGAGRSDHGEAAGLQHRYGVMSLLFAYATFFAAVLAERASPIGRWLQWGWLAIATVAVIVASSDGVRAGRHYRATLADAEARIPVLPDDILGEELETLLHGGSGPLLANRIGALRSAGLLPELRPPPEAELRRYRSVLVLRLLEAGRLAAAERQIVALAESGSTPQVTQLRERLNARRAALSRP